MTHYIFDCDDVLLNWMGGFQAFLERRGIAVDPDGAKTWTLNSWIGCTESAAASWVARFNASRSFGELHAMPGALAATQVLRAAGHTMSVLTACGSSESIGKARWKNLDKEFPGAFADMHVLPLRASKATALADYVEKHTPAGLVFVEDHFRHALAGAQHGIKTYCLRRSHNRADEANSPGVIWIDDLSDLIEKELV